MATAVVPLPVLFLLFLLIPLPLLFLLLPLCSFVYPSDEGFEWML